MITFLKPEEQHQHPNGGGWVANTATVAASAFVGRDALVYGNARVSGDAQVSGSAWETSPLYIQGSKHGLTNSAYGYLNIGCIKLPFSEWKKRYKEIGKEQNYTPAQIKEYGKFIALATTLGRNKTYGKA